MEMCTVGSMLTGTPVLRYSGCDFGVFAAQLGANIDYRYAQAVAFVAIYLVSSSAFVA